MAGYEGGSERMWDEYEWERFLQEQDQKTEKYMQLVETYLDDPQRDEIIAREMGWTQLLEAKDWSAEVDALFDEDVEQDDDLEPDGASLAAETFEEHHLYQAAFALTIWIDELFDQKPSLQNEPAAIKLATHSALASAKLAAALSGDDVDEIGMTIAYLKRALKAMPGRRHRSIRRVGNPLPDTSIQHDLQYGAQRARRLGSCSGQLSQSVEVDQT